MESLRGHEAPATATGGVPVSRRIEDLGLDTRRKCELLIELCRAEGINVVPVQTYRSSSEQELIYAKGRTRPGEPCRHLWPPRVRQVGTCKRHPLGATVTNAPSGHSFHEAGRACDFAFRVGVSGISWAGPWERFGLLATQCGLHWGGHWATPDRPHVEDPLPPGLTLAQAIVKRESAV